MRRANGTGSVSKVTDRKRRKPWRVRITEKWELDQEEEKIKQITKVIGSYATKAEAEAALVHYLECPYDLGSKNLTFEEVYRKWSEGYFKDVADTYIRSVECAFAYCHSLHRIKMRDIRSYHLKDCMEQGYIIVKRANKPDEKRMASASTKSRMKSVFNLVFDYAYEHEVVDRNYARAFNTDKDLRKQIRQEKRENYIFTAEEIAVLWENVDKVRFTDMLLIDLYSGWRPQELSLLKVVDIDLAANTMKGGLKTEAGMNRVVPIHPLVRPLIEARLAEAQKMESEYLFNDEDGIRGTFMTYDKYRSRFNKVVKRLGMENHHPHEARHTFITKAKEAGMDEYILKMIVGHCIDDITEKVYTHRTMEQLQTEMLKIVR